MGKAETFLEETLANLVEWFIEGGSMARQVGNGHN
jgi:hypothetical protein